MLQIHPLRSGEKADSRAMNCFSDFSISNICVQNRRFSTLPDDVTYLIIDKLTTFQTQKPTNMQRVTHMHESSKLSLYSIPSIHSVEAFTDLNNQSVGELIQLTPCL